jgi:ribosomal protein S18 acetylase RimI-like enzyme
MTDAMEHQAYQHTPTSPLLLAALKSTLPYSIPLVHRTQHLASQTPSTYILSTLPPTTRPAPSAIPPCWAAAYLDRSARPETELWIFAAGQVPGHTSSPSRTPDPVSSPSPAETDLENGTTKIGKDEKNENEKEKETEEEKEPFCPTCKTAIHTLLTHISTLPIPPMRPHNQHTLQAALAHQKAHPATGPHARYPPSPGTYLRHLLDPSVITLGAVHAQIAQICLKRGIVRREYPGMEDLLNTFVFRVSDLPEPRPLPEGLRWGRMREKDIPLVQARTHIPRSANTLLSLESVGVFEESTDKAVAWAFLAADGSLCSLHTEPEYRGKGIAKAVAVRIFKEFAPELAVDDEGTAWAHADVYVGNAQSESVCKSLGGKPMWNSFWVRISLGTPGERAQEAIDIATRSSS